MYNFKGFLNFRWPLNLKGLHIHAYIRVLMFTFSIAYTSENPYSTPVSLSSRVPWPLLASLIAIVITSRLLVWFHSQSLSLFLIRLFLMVLIITQWWRDVRIESSILGFHTHLVGSGFRYGIKLFIVSEVLFFARFFWFFFFHARLSPNIELGGIWPPSGILPFNKFGVPLLNTVVL